MPLVRVAPETECAELVADIVADALEADDPVIGLATGRSTVAMHSRLVEMHRAGSLDASRARWLMLDELLQLDSDDPRTFRNTLRRDLIDPLGIDPQMLIGPDLALDNPDAIAEQFRRAASTMVAGVQVLGIGRNGHVGFNEPGSQSTSRTRTVTLTAQTVADLVGHDWSPSGPPRLAVTRGVADIMEARTLVLVAFGSNKSAPIRGAVLGPMTPECPASLLREHPDLRIFLDAEAAALL